MSILRRILAFSRNPWVMIIAGLFLTLSSVWELGRDVLEMSEGLKGEHGTLFFGFIVIIRSLGEIDEGLGMMAEGDEGSAA